MVSLLDPLQSFSYLTSPTLDSVPTCLTNLAVTDALMNAAEGVDQYVVSGDKEGLKSLLSLHNIPLEPQVVRQFTAARLIWQEMADERWQAVTRAVVHFSNAVDLLDQALVEIREVPYPDERGSCLNQRNSILRRMGIGKDTHAVEPFNEQAQKALSEINSSPHTLTHHQRFIVRYKVIPCLVDLGQRAEACRILKLLKESAISPEGQFNREEISDISLRMARTGMNQEAAELMRLVTSDLDGFLRDEKIDQKDTLQDLIGTAAILGDNAFLDSLPQWIDISEYGDMHRWSFELTVSRALSKTGRHSEAREILGRVLSEIRKYMETTQDPEEIEEYEAFFMDEAIEALAEQETIPELLTFSGIYQARIYALYNRGVYDEDKTIVLIARQLAKAGLFDEAKSTLEEYFAHREMKNRGFLEVPQKFLLAGEKKMMADFLISAAEDCYAKAQEEASLLGGLDSEPFRQEARRHMAVASSAYLRMISRLPGGLSLFNRGLWFVKALLRVISRNDVHR